MSTLAEDGASCESGGKGTMPKVEHRLHGSAWARGKQVRDCHRARARRSADFDGLEDVSWARLPCRAHRRHSLG